MEGNTSVLECDDVATDDESISLLQVRGRIINVTDDDITKSVQESNTAVVSYHGTTFDVILAEGHDNLCQQGKHLPELFVLGCQKCASSSFAEDILSTGTDSVHGMNPDKPHKKGDWHIFAKMNERCGSLHKDCFLETLPPCDKFTGVLGSFSADQFHLTDLSDLYEEVDPRLKSWKQHVDAPKLLSKYYGNDIKRPVFTVLLREPLERFQSAYYFFLQTKDIMKSTGLQGSDFNQFTQRTVVQSQETGKYNWILWTSLYGKHMHAWSQQIDPSSMIIIPMYSYARATDGWLKACRSLSSRLNIVLRCGSRTASRENQNEHPPLSEDITEDSRNQFYKFLQGDHQKLVDVLVQINQGGGELVTFDGSSTAAAFFGGDAVNTWLCKGWSSDGRICPVTYFTS